MMYQYPSLVSFKILSWESRGFVLDALNQFENAIKSYQKTIELSNEYADGWFNSGRSYFHLEKYESALSCFNTALKIDWSDNESFEMKKEAMRKLGREDAILEELETIIDKNDENASLAWFRKGRELDWIGERDLALVAFDSALAISPSSSTSSFPLTSI